MRKVILGRRRKNAPNPDLPLAPVYRQGRSVYITIQTGKNFLFACHATIRHMPKQVGQKWICGFHDPLAPWRGRDIETLKQLFISIIQELKKRRNVSIIEAWDPRARLFSAVRAKTAVETAEWPR